MYNNEKESSGGKIERYVIGDGFGMMAVDSGDAETATEFDGQDGDVSTKMIQIGGRDYEYVTWGDDDQMPYRLRNRVNDCMITAQSQFFNELACYGQGLHFHRLKPDGDPSGTVACADGVDPSHPLFMFNLLDNPTQTYLEMCVDMKFFFFSVVVLELSRDGHQIVHHIRRRRTAVSRSTGNGSSTATSRTARNSSRRSSRFIRCSMCAVLPRTSSCAPVGWHHRQTA